MNINREFSSLLAFLNPEESHMAHTAYDTAWIARMNDPIGKRAAEWLRAHQLADGSWGAERPLYYHDRLICTLAAIIALARRGNEQDIPRLKQAEAILSTMIEGLPLDPAGETIGFEMIAPMLLKEAELLGISPCAASNHLLAQLAHKRAAKLAALPQGLVSRHATVAFSAEMAGPDGLHLLDIPNLLEINGSVGHSPSATAYFLTHVNSHDDTLVSAARQYLDKVTTKTGGAVPNVAPFDIFEMAWVLWNLSLVALLDKNVRDACQPHLQYLYDAWKPGHGAGFAAGYTPKDADGTSVVYDVLCRFGNAPDLQALLRFEGAHYFHCYLPEANPSTSTNIHVLSSLRQANLAPEHPAVSKVLNYLSTTRKPQGYWFDKWHASPYYPTSHAIISCANYADDLIQPAIEWILSTQNSDGSWGFYGPSAEETAYCLQALTLTRQPVATEVLLRGQAWLEANGDTTYPPLWIGKCLYCPGLVVRSAILSALALCRWILPGPNAWNQ